MVRRILPFLLVFALAAPAGVPNEAWANEGGGKKAKPAYLQLDTLAVSVVRGGGRRGVLTVEVGLDAEDPVLRDKVEVYQPYLRSAFISALQPYALGLSPGASPNADYISMTLQREADRVLGRRGAKLLLGSILVN